MTLPTHLLAGLIIGSATGEYIPAIIGATAIDLDHVFSYAKSGILWKPKKMIRALLDTEDPWGNQRSIFHSVPLVVIIAAILIYKFPGNPTVLAFVLGYASHIFLDALDGSEYWPLFPIRKPVFRGPIRYASKQEFFFAIGLVISLSILLFL